MSYIYDAADQISEITYPSGRQVKYTRDTMARITQVDSRKISTDPWSTVSDEIVYQPMSRLVKEMDFANGLNTWNTYTQDYELDVLGLYDGSTDVINRAHTRTDDLNLTNIWDNVTAANNQSFWYNASNKLQNADGPWGSHTYYYDGVGNRTQRLVTPSGGSQTTENYGYAATDNRVSDVTVGATALRTFGYDASGNMTSDVRSGTTYAYTYNNAGRLTTLSYGGNLRGTYTYNGKSQLAKRVITNMGADNGTTEFVHDLSGNVIAEADGTGQSLREYLWLPDAGYARTDLPLATVDGVASTPVLYHVHTDHISRPVMMTDSSKTNVWQATWGPFGQAHSITGSASKNLRFPGQWYQLEAGLHYNWHRHYDPSLGRYTQPDPLGFVDGPSVYAYAGSNPQMRVDPDGRFFFNPITYQLGRLALTAAARYVVPKLLNAITSAASDSSGSSGDVIPFPGGGGSRKNNDECDDGDDGCAKEQARIQKNVNAIKQVIKNALSNGNAAALRNISLALPNLNKEIAIHNAKCPLNQVEQIPPLRLGPQR